jgi:hypothetical protein
MISQNCTTPYNGTKQEYDYNSTCLREVEKKLYQEQNNETGTNTMNRSRRIAQRDKRQRL